MIPNRPRKLTISEVPPADFGPLLADYLASPHTWDKGIYDEARLRKSLLQADHWALAGFVDFESWYRERFLPFVS